MFSIVSAHSNQLVLSWPNAILQDCWVLIQVNFDTRIETKQRVGTLSQVGSLSPHYIRRTDEYE